MKSKVTYVAIATCLAVVFLTGCNTKNKKTEEGKQPVEVADAAHNSRNSLDYEGTYSGTVPCADCSGIYMEITLNGDRFEKKMVYQGKESGENTFETSGTYSWNTEGSIITLNDDWTEQYQVGESLLFVLDENGKRITGDLAENYILRKK